MNVAVEYPGYGDGIGSQLQRRLSLWAWCELTGNTYVHQPFFSLEHNYKKDPKFESKCETFFNIGQDEITVADHGTRPLIKEISKTKYFDSNGADLYDTIRDKFIHKYNITHKPKLLFDSDYTNVAIHIRRGDVVDRNLTKRYIHDQYYVDHINNISQLFSNDCKFYIFSESTKTKNIFKQFEQLDHDVNLMIDGCPLEAFHHMLHADVLITGASSFSYVPALMSKNKIYYTQFWHAPKTYWNINK